MEITNVEIGRVITEITIIDREGKEIVEITDVQKVCIEKSLKSLWKSPK